MLIEVGSEVRVRIEVPRGSLVKRAADGGIDFLSPVPCPFNYGSVVGTTAPDGDPVDAVVLGPALGAGREAAWLVWGRVDFVDGGVDDAKWICAAEAPTAAELRRIDRFFALYTWAKRAMNRARGRTGWTGVRR